MMRVVARLFFIGLMLSASAGSAYAQNIDQIIRDIGRLGQPRRATIQAEWERISPGEILCVDNRLRRNRRSVNSLIDRGIGPSDNRVAGIVSECRADTDVQTDIATPSFNCRAATYADEKAICATPELARLDRAVVEAYGQVLGREGARNAKSISDPLLRQRHDCGPDVDCIKRVQLSAIAAFQARGAAVQVPAPAQVTERSNAAYTVNGMQLGSNFAASADSRDYACAPSPRFDGFTECQRQTAERSRRRRISESASVLHAADGSAAYINQSFEPVAMGDEDADDEIARLSETYGKAILLPLTDSRGQRSGVIAAWGTVSLLPLEPERRAALASGTDDQPGILIDHIGNVQRSAQQGLPVYLVSGGAGYVWSASWNGRGRGTLRMVAVDASRLPGAADAANPAPVPAAAPTAESNAATPSAPVAEAPRPAEVTPPPAPPAAPKPAEPVVVQPPAKPAPPDNVRVVGPPIELRPAAAESAAPSTNSGSGNGLVIFLIALVAVLLGAVGYLYRKSRATAAGVGAKAPASAATPTLAVTPAAAAVPTPATTPEVAAAPAVATRPDVVTAPASKMDLTALVPAESPDSMTGSAPTIIAPKEAAMTPDAGDVTKRDRVEAPTITTPSDK